MENAAKRTFRRLVEAEKISHCWKLWHVLLLVLVAVFGISGGVVLSLLFQEDEILCGTPTLIQSINPFYGKPNITCNGTYIDLDIITSGKNDNACDFTQYTLVCSFIFGTIWMVFFLMCGRGGRSHTGLPQPWRIVIPSLIFTTIFTVISFGASVQLTMAVTTFCQEFDNDYNSVCQPQLPGKCQDLDKFLPKRKSYYIAIQHLISLGESLTWLTTIAWGCSAALCVVRLLAGPDFRPVLSPNPVETTPPDSTGPGYKTLSNTPSAPGSPILITSHAHIHHQPNVESESNAENEGPAIHTKPSLPEGTTNYILKDGPISPTLPDKNQAGFD